jgi:predicted DCC family thiol-disulfide oxidoreductase YuxK
MTGEGVWFVYDGDCPVCSMAAHALRIKALYGPLHLINAREDGSSPLLDEITRRELNLDEGMVIVCEGRLYHGANALRFMAEHGDSKGLFNACNRALFRSEAVAKLAYPWMRRARNFLLILRRVSKLNNLRSNDEPVFKAVFGRDWDRLPTIMRRHYANRPFHNDTVTVEGTLNIVFSPFGRILKPAFRFAKTLVYHEGVDVPVVVQFETDAQSGAFRFDRTFHFAGMEPFHFRSAMIPLHGKDVVEQMGAGLCWRMTYAWTGEKVVLAHKGYAVRLFGFFIPLPLAVLLGKGYAEEVPLSDDAFSMTTEIRHPLWGFMFGYNGTFRVTKDA